MWQHYRSTAPDAGCGCSFLPPKYPPKQQFLWICPCAASADPSQTCLWLLFHQPTSLCGLRSLGLHGSSISKGIILSTFSSAQVLVVFLSPHFGCAVEPQTLILLFFSSLLKAQLNHLLEQLLSAYQQRLQILSGLGTNLGVVPKI